MRLSGASILCWSLFEKSALRDVLCEDARNHLSYQASSLTGHRKFDTFEKFAQKCWRTQSRQNQQRIQVRGQPDLTVRPSILGLRSGGTLLRIFDNQVEHASREK